MVKGPELPEWFKLENYQEAEKYSAVQWFDKLSTRYGYITCMNTYKACLQDGENMDKDLAHFSRLMANRYYNSICEHGKTTEILIGKQASVSTLSVLDIFHCLENLKNEDKKAYVYFKKKFGPDKPLLFAGEIEPTHTVPSSMVGYAKIDLLSSDEQIFDDLRVWLLTERKKQPFKTIRKKAFTSPEFKKWINSKILPYLDLMIWSEQTNTILSLIFIGDTLFPNSDGDPSRKIEKTVKPKADDLMTQEAMLAFGAQIQSLSSRQKSV